MTFLTSQFGEVDSNNSAGLALAIAGSFVGTYTDSENRASFTISLFIAGAQAATVAVDQSPDNGVTVRTTTYVVSAQSNNRTVTVVDQFNRIRVLADQGTAVTGYVQTIFHAATALPVLQNLSSTLAATSESVTTRSLAVANNAGVYQDVQIGSGNGVLVTQTNPYSGNNLSFFDSFGRARVSTPFPVITSKLLSSTANARDWSELQVSGAGTSSTYSANRASVTMSVSNLTAGRRIRQSVFRCPYLPGTSALNFLTCVPGPSPAGITKRWGTYDDNNGIFFQTRNNILEVGLRTSVSGAPVDTIVGQGSFNFNPLPVGFSLTYTGLFQLDFAWLGVGAVRYTIETAEGPLILHIFENSTATSVWASSPVWPFRYEIINDGTGPAASLECICTSHLVEAGLASLRRVPRAALRGTTQINIINDGNDYILIALRQNPTQLFSVVSFVSFFMMCLTGISQYIWKLLYKATSSVALTWINSTQTGAQYAIPGSGAVGLAIATGGNLLTSGYSDATNQSSGQTNVNLSDLYLGAQADGTPFELFLTVQKIDGGAADQYVAALNWLEDV